MIMPEVNRLLWALRDVVAQHIHCKDDLFDSEFIRANRTALEILVEYGHMVLVGEDTGGGRWYQARLVPADETPNAFGKNVEGHDDAKSAEAAAKALQHQLDHFFDESPLQRRLREQGNK